MHSERFRAFRAVTASALALFAIPQSMVAQAADHLVSTTELQKAAVGASQQRQQNLDTLKSFLSTDKAAQAIKSAHMDPKKVTNAVASLSDDELAQLATRANKAQAEFAAGTLDNRDLLIILVAIAALILIIVAVR
jgi:cellulase/cellobiase CelA1